jgi:hypothetical protein
MLSALLCAAAPSARADPPQETPTERISAAVSAVRERTDPNAIARLSPLGVAVLPRLSTEFRPYDTAVGLAIVKLAASFPGRESVALLSAAASGSDEAVAVAAMRTLFTSYTPLTLPELGGQATKLALIAGLAKYHVDIGAYMLTWYGQDADVISFLRSAAGDAIEPGQALKPFGANPPLSIVQYQETEDRWSLAVYAAGAELREPWAINRLAARIDNARPADLLALFARLDNIDNPGTLAALNRSVADHRVCITTSVNGSVQTTTDLPTATAPPANPLQSFRICDIAAVQLARKAGIKTGVPALDSVTRTPWSDSAVLRLSDTDITRAQTALATYYGTR